MRAGPRFCPWCGTEIGFEHHADESPFASLATDAKASDPELPVPSRIVEMLTPECFVGPCPECRVLTHLVSDHAAEDYRAK